MGGKKLIMGSLYLLSVDFTRIVNLPFGKKVLIRKTKYKGVIS